MHSEDHVTDMETNDSIWMGSAIIEQMCEFLHGLGSIGLLRGKGTEGNQHSWINSMDTNDLLNTFAVSSIKHSHMLGSRVYWTLAPL